jgi:hypothetical protein
MSRQQVRRWKRVAQASGTAGTLTAASAMKLLERSIEFGCDANSSRR